MAHELLLCVRLGNITMPVPDRDIPIGTKVCQALELIIDEGFLTVRCRYSPQTWADWHQKGSGWEKKAASRLA